MHLKDLKQQALNNTTFRTVLANGKHTQIVVMHINPGEDIGLETHPDNDQVLYLVSGKGEVVLNGEKVSLTKAMLC